MKFLMLDNSGNIYLYVKGMMYQRKRSLDVNNMLMNLLQKIYWRPIRNYHEPLYLVTPETISLSKWRSPLDPVLIDVKKLSFDLSKIYKIYTELLMTNNHYPDGEYTHLFIGNEGLREISLIGNEGLINQDLPKTKFNINFPSEYGLFGLHLHFNPNIDESFLMSKNEL